VYKSKEIEKWGSGLKRIYEECRSHDVRVEFETLKSGFVVVFYRDLAITKTEGIQEGGGISEGIKSLLTYIESNPGKRINIIAQEMNKPAKTI
jgi:ATP-dependent DNA helicase RecG